MDTVDMARQRLAAYKQQLDAAIAAYIKHLTADMASYSIYSRETVNAYISILARGGKRLRGALVMNAYEMCGGTNKQLALQAAVAIELIHAYILVIDDICDRSQLRRGGPTAHIMLADYHKQHHLHGDSQHFGLAQAMNAASFGGYLAQMELAKLPTDDATKLGILHDVNNTIAVTFIRGQCEDIFNEAVQTVDETQVLSVLKWKTAYYSFLNPLRVGAALAHADPAELAVLEGYCEHMGLAFQITDDILGTFGDEIQSGKSTQDDIKEGKITLLIARALKKADDRQRQALLQALGNDTLTQEEYEACKRVIEDTGALAYSQELAEQHAHQATAALGEVPKAWAEPNVAFLRALAQLIVNRSS